ncbi:spore coat protein SP96-like, partial [Neolamprologus brichardi]|uniref:spore coat protein SP96-like n=1 Tax=Neolamprologus brichardi TaxID=32507 RepID=UPI001643DDF3
MEVPLLLFFLLWRSSCAYTSPATSTFSSSTPLDLSNSAQTIRSPGNAVTDNLSPPDVSPAVTHLSPLNGTAAFTMDQSVASETSSGGGDSLVRTEMVTSSYELLSSIARNQSKSSGDGGVTLGSSRVSTGGATDVITELQPEDGSTHQTSAAPSDSTASAAPTTPPPSASSTSTHRPPRTHSQTPPTDSTLHPNISESLTQGVLSTAPTGDAVPASSTSAPSVPQTTTNTSTTAAVTTPSTSSITAPAPTTAIKT